MEIKLSWSASSKQLEEQTQDDLSKLVGRWNSELLVTISNPSTFSEGPIIQHVTSE